MKYFSQNKKPLTKREQLLIEVMESGHRLARLVVALREVMAKIIEAPATDILCMEFLIEKGIATAGELAKVAGLSTGGITGTITRMQEAGWISYERDAKDKRKVIVKPIPKNLWWVHSCLHPIFTRTEKMYRGLPTQKLELIVKSHNKVGDIYEEEISKLAKKTKPKD